MNFRARIDRIAKVIKRPEPGDCTFGTTCLINKGDPVPDDAMRCPRCGSMHIVEIEEVIVDSFGKDLAPIGAMP